jgi:hypothetical protein
MSLKLHVGMVPTNRHGYMRELHSENLTLGTVIPFEKLLIIMFGITSKQLLTGHKIILKTSP